MRLAKFLAHCGVASRRAAEVLIADGRVTVGGEFVRDPARDVDGSEPVQVDGQPIALPAERVVYAVNKPRGVVSTAKDTHGRRTVTELVAVGRRLYPVGRLDADSTGLILLTDDGDLADRMMHPRHEVSKTYRARVANGPVGGRALRTLREGVKLDEATTLPATIAQPRPGVLEITIREGRKRQVRRMCEAVGHPVIALERIAFGPLKLGDLEPGGHRRLTPSEVADLRGGG